MSFSYFSKLNYTCANEDTWLEWHVLPNKSEHVVSVCGSGSRVLPLIARKPSNLTIVDLSEEQLFLAQLRLALIKSCEHHQFLDFLGYTSDENSAENRKNIFSALTLSDRCRNFFKALFKEIAWGPILYLGRWEKTIAKLARINQKFTGEKGREIFDCESLESQRQFYSTEFPLFRWHLVLRLMGNANVFNALLYKGHFPVKNIPGTFFEFFKTNLGRLFQQDLARQNFFLQLLFYGKIAFPEAFIAEADAGIFAVVKSHLNDLKVNYKQGNIVDEVALEKMPIDFVSISDVPSYFSGKTEQNFMQQMKAGLRVGGKVLVRSYQHVPWRPDLTDFTIITGLFRDALEAEKTQVYLVDIYQRAK